MAKPAKLKIISANRLADGIVVYFAEAGIWTPDIAQARRLGGEAELEPALALAKADEKRNLILDPFAVDVKEVDTKGLEAVSLRNAIRAKGPTVDYLLKPEESPRS